MSALEQEQTSERLMEHFPAGKIALSAGARCLLPTMTDRPGPDVARFLGRHEARQFIYVIAPSTLATLLRGCGGTMSVTLDGLDRRQVYTLVQHYEPGEVNPRSCAFI